MEAATTRSLKRLAPTALLVCVVLLGGLSPTSTAEEPKAAPKPAADPGLPFVYRSWQQFTKDDGLPNDHVFAVKADGDRIWVGTEDGLARLDKKTGKIKSWKEKDGLPWKVVSALEVDPVTKDVWIGLFGGGLARLSGGRFDHWHQLNSGLVNDVVYGLCLEGNHVWIATTAGASRFNTKTGEWSIFTEKNSPMEEIWNYGCSAADGRVYLSVWGSGVLEYDIAKGTWKDYLDPDREMEIDLYRDDGIVHVITTGVTYIEKTLWVSTYFGCCRYDGRHWRGYYAHETGLPSDFNNAARGRSKDECWYCTDKGIGVVTDFATDTWVTYTSDYAKKKGKAVVQRGKQVVAEIETDYSLPHNYVLWADFDGDDVWVGTSKGLARAVGQGYYPRLRKPTKGQ